MAGTGTNETVRQTDVRACPGFLFSGSEAVRVYFLIRAAGFCESSGCDAPFLRKDGSHCLEPHQTKQRSEFRHSLGHPNWVAGIYRNCHREIQFGIDGKEKNKTLAATVAEIAMAMVV